MSSNKNSPAKAVIRRLLEVGYTGNHRLVDELVDDTYVDHGFWRNKGKLLQTLTALCAAYPSLACNVEEIIGEGDTVAAFYGLTATSRSEQKSIHAVGLFRLRDGKVVEHWGFSDSFF